VPIGAQYLDIGRFRPIRLSGAARSPLGKRIGRDLLKVVWTDEVGSGNSIAICVPELDGYLQTQRN
jgi:hypothetical protein